MLGNQSSSTECICVTSTEGEVVTIPSLYFGQKSADSYDFATRG